MLQPKEYVEAEKQYFPEEWDELTKGQVAFMIAEAFQAGVNNGWTEGKKRGREMAVMRIKDAVDAIEAEK